MLFEYSETRLARDSADGKSGRKGVNTTRPISFRIYFRREVRQMKKVILAMASLGMIALLVTMAPDIRRYLRIRSM
jgi:hypothetical protein